MKRPLLWFTLWASTMAVISGLIIRDKLDAQVNLMRLRLDALEDRLRVAPIDTLCTLTAEIRDLHEMLAAHNRDAHPHLAPDPPLMSPEACRGYVVR